MTPDPTDRLAELTEQEDQLVLESFDHAAAWRLGSRLVERGLREGAAIIVDIRRPRMILFRAALAGTTPENEAWLDRKARTVLHFETSTARLAARSVEQGIDLWTAPWFDTDRFTAAAGSFPIRVRGVGVVAALTVSGLSSDEDHAYAVAALTAYAAGDERSDEEDGSRV